MIGSSDGRAAGPVKTDTRRKRGAMASLNRACLRPAHTRPADIDEGFTSPVLALETAWKKSREVYEKSNLQKGGESGLIDNYPGGTLLHR
jgi:hypothetical protein